MTSVVNDCFSSVSYVIADHILIDPGDIKPSFGQIDIVLLTHAHFDHIYGLNELLSLSHEVKVYTNSTGKEMLLNAKKNLSFYHETPFVFEHPEQIVVVEDGDQINLGNDFTAKAVFTPGHNPSCITWVIGDSLFTGDAYIPGLKTVTNLPGGNRLQSEESLKLIKQLAKDRTIYPGHLINQVKDEIIR